MRESEGVSETVSEREGGRERERGTDDDSWLGAVLTDIYMYIHTHTLNHTHTHTHQCID